MSCQSEAKETRRGFIKAGAALLGLVPAMMIHRNSEKRLANGKGRLVEELNKADDTAHEEDMTAIANYFGKGITGTAEDLHSTIAAAKTSLGSSEVTPAVSAALQTFVKAGEEYQSALQALSSDPESIDLLGLLAKSATVTEQLEAAKTADERLATTTDILEGLGILGVMAAVTYAGAYRSNRIDEKPDNSRLA